MVEALRHEAAENWNQTFYLLYFRTLGDRQNQEAYLTLARRVSYKTVLRERLAPHAVESLLFGASDCWRSIRTTPTRSTSPAISNIWRPNTTSNRCRPELGSWATYARQPPRTAAGASRGILRSGRIRHGARHACRTEEEIRRLFCVEASDYWRTHHIPGIAGDDRPKRLGTFKPTSSASTSSRCCNSPTAATPDAKPCATAP